LVTDASLFGLGVILQQRDDDGNIHPVSFGAKKLLPAQKNYSALELEASALFYAFMDVPILDKNCMEKNLQYGQTTKIW